MASSSQLSVASEPPTVSSLRADVSAETARWQSVRWRRTVRPFSAASVVSLRCPLPSRLSFAGTVPAVKLHALLRQHFEHRTFAHTFGCMDPVQVGRGGHNTAGTGHQSTATALTAAVALTYCVPLSLATASLVMCCRRCRRWLLSGGGHGPSPVDCVCERLAVLVHCFSD